MSVGIRDIAAAAGVSPATVSRVLNRTGVVRPQVRERVLATASRLGYRPNSVARSLRLRRTHSLGVVLPTITNPYFTDSVRAMQDAAAEHGLILLIANSDRDPGREEEALHALLERRVDGIVLVSAAPLPSVALKTVVQRGTPVVILERVVPNVRADLVLGDQRGGARLAVEHLLERDRRRIAFLAGPPAIWTSEEKLAGYQEALAAAGLEFDPALVMPGDNTQVSGEASAELLLGLEPRPDAVLVANNLMALGLLRQLLARGLDLPAEMALVAFDDVAWADVVRPALTVVAQPNAELGRRAVETLVRRLQERGQPAEPTVEVLPTRLIVRGSS